jgi:uncharacterized integral membrane protein
LLNSRNSSTIFLENENLKRIYLELLKRFALMNDYLQRKYLKMLLQCLRRWIIKISYDVFSCFIIIFLFYIFILMNQNSIELRNILFWWLRRRIIKISYD